MDAPRKLRAWRGKRTLREAAELVGCDPSYLSLLENRKKKPFDRKLSLQLERIVGIPPEAWDEEDDGAVHGGMLADTLTPVKATSDLLDFPPNSEADDQLEAENPGDSDGTPGQVSSDDSEPSRCKGAA
jgi:transcriptional regulator with XRE-family HTH domain